MNNNFILDEKNKCFRGNEIENGKLLQPRIKENEKENTKQKMAK